MHPSRNDYHNKSYSLYLQAWVAGLSVLGCVGFAIEKELTKIAPLTATTRYVALAFLIYDVYGVAKFAWLPNRSVNGISPLVSHVSFLPFSHTNSFHTTIHQRIHREGYTEIYVVPYRTAPMWGCLLQYFFKGAMVPSPHDRVRKQMKRKIPQHNGHFSN